MALRHARRGECRGCGQPLAESTDPANEYGYEPAVYACHSCRVKAAAEERAEAHHYVGTVRRS